MGARGRGNGDELEPDRPELPRPGARALGGPGTDSGTFDYFTDVINGEEGASRADYNATEDDNVIVQAVAGDPGALGYFGYTYYEQNQDTPERGRDRRRLRLCRPEPETAQDGSYTPLSRPLFIYVKTESLARPEVAAFAQYLLDNNAAISEAALFIPLNDEQLATSQETLAAALG